MKNVVSWDIKPSSYLTGNTLFLRCRAQPVNAIRFEVFTAVTVKNVVFWDIKTQFLPHWKHLRCRAQPVNTM
jgi:hypothetical protein